MPSIPEKFRAGTLHFSENYGNILITNYIHPITVSICFLNTGNEIKCGVASVANGKLIDKKEKYGRLAEILKNTKPCVYLISYGGTKYIKIGWSGNIDQRIHCLSGGSPHDLSIVKLFICNSREEARKLESVIHKICQNYRFKGEWFLVNNTTSFIKFIEDSLIESN